MKRIIATVLLCSIAVLSFAQPQGQMGQQGPRGQRPEGAPRQMMQRPDVPPASPQNAMHSPILAMRKTTVEKVAYDAYEESNAVAKDSDVIFIGDSITENWYTFHHDFFDVNNFLARGIGGQTTISILCRFRQDVVKNNPKVVAIMCGINDVAQNDGPMKQEYLLDNIVAMCDQAKANGIKVLLCSLTPCDRFFWNKEAVPAPEVYKLNAAFKAIADSDENITYVDYHTPMDNGQGGMKQGYSNDGCHPTTVGYNVMERIIVKEINKALNNNTEYFVTPEE